MGNQQLSRDSVTGVVLAGGRATRMGGQDKGLVTIAGQPMVAHVLERLRPQVKEVLVNANRNLSSYAALGVRVVSDREADFAGPLAGMASGLAAAGTSWVMTAPCDSPLLPADLLQRLSMALERDDAAELAVAHGEGRMQPVFALLPVHLLESMESYLAAGGRKIDRWYAQHRVALADLSDVPSTFFNVNTPEQRQQLEDRLRSAIGTDG